jgi:hypothetical protein
MANNFEKLIEVYANQIQDLETVFLDLMTETRIDSAEGVQLDRIGKIIGLERGGASDELYRDLLSAQIAVNLASGTIPEILTILNLILGDEVDLVLREYFPAGFEVEAVQQPITSDQATSAVAAVKTSKAGGVKGLFRYYLTEPVFRLDGSGGSQFDGGYYFSTSL